MLLCQHFTVWSCRLHLLAAQSSMQSVAYFFGGALFVNGFSHWNRGLSGRPFPTPFASPSNKGLSSSLVNVIWGLSNLVTAYLLLCRVGGFDVRDSGHVVPFSLGFVGISVMQGYYFGHFYRKLAK